MEDCSPAKRLRPSITFWPSNCGHEGFCGGDIASVVVPDGIEELEDHAYDHWLHVTSVTLPNSVKIVGEYVFYDCRSLSSLTLSNSLRIVGNYAFGGCFGLTSLTLPKSVETLGEGAFERCEGLTSLTLPASLQSVAPGAFSGCKGLTSLTLPNSLQSIGDKAFRHCGGLTSLTLPDSLKNVGKCAFEDCRKLTNVSFPPSLGRGDVGERTFAGCYDLVSVDFRSSSRPAFIAWAVGSSQNRNNWQVTTVMRLRNVLNLITVLAWTPRDVDSVDPHGLEGVFLYCPCGREHRCFPCDESVDEDEYAEWSEYRSRWS